MVNVKALIFAKARSTYDGIQSDKHNKKGKDRARYSWLI